MACSQTLSGLINDCAANMGGVRKVYLANKTDVSGVTVSEDKVTGISMASEAKFHGYALRPNTASMNSTAQVSQENGTTYWQTLLQMVFSRMETTKRVEVVAMAQAELCAIVEDANGLFWFLGMDAPLVLNAGDGNTGTARGDRNGYSVTLEDDSLQPPYEILVGDGGVDLDRIVA